MTAVFVESEYEIELAGVQGPAGAGLSAIANNTLLGNTSGASASPVARTAQQMGVLSALDTQTFSTSEKAKLGDNSGWYGTILDLPAAPSAAVNATAGNLNGTYWYAVSFVNAIGETGNVESSVSVSPANQQVDLTAIPTGPSGTTARKIYRGINTGYDLRLVTTINDNTTTTFTDNVSNATVAASPRMPRVNTTGGCGFLNGDRHAAITNIATIIGFGAAPNNAGISNTIIGKNAGKENHWGYWLALIGEEAGQENTTGFEVVSVGFRAGKKNTTGFYNVNIGVAAGQENQTSANRTNVGYAAGRNGTVSSDTNIGAYAGLSLTTGGRNTTLGDSAGAFLNDGSTPLTGAAACVYLGAGAYSNAVDSDHEIVIGADARGNGTYTTVIGTTSHIEASIYGRTVIHERCFDSVSAVMRLQPIPSDNARGKGVAIFFNAQPTDQNALFPTGSIYAKWDGTTYNTERMTFQSAVDGGLVDTISFKQNRVGIGTINPAYKVHVVAPLSSGVNSVYTLSADGAVGSRGNGVGQLFLSQPTDSNTLFASGRVYSRFSSTTYQSSSLTLQACDDGGSLVDRLAVQHTGVLLFVDGAMKLVSVGASDSGGTGFKLLRVPN